jgi:predicted fused transcriptional regulator/phosphomethylpyrimidine kinase
MPKRSEGEVILGNMVSAIRKLEGCREFTLLIPEVRVNLVYALPKAQTPQEVAGIEGRLTAVHGFPRSSGTTRLAR